MDLTPQWQSAFDTALSVDGQHHDFTFDDGIGDNNVVKARIKCLWITERYADWHTHTHYLNTITSYHQPVVMMRACDVPNNAILVSNSFLTVDGIQYRIETSILEYSIWELDLAVLNA